MRTNVGIYGVGAFLPEEIRTNDWWPKTTVEEWERKAVISQARLDERVNADLPAGQRIVLEQMRRLRNDPFRGAVERRVMPKGMTSSDMEIAAAKEAIERAGVQANDIDFVMTYSFCPDELLCSNAFILHDALGLSKRCFTTGVEAACNSFLMGLTLAEQMIAGGQAKLGLLIQSCGISRILPHEEQSSAWFGDGAAAVVIGPTSSGRGILGRAHRTESRLHRAVVTGVPGAAWYEEGRSYFFAKDRSAAFEIMLTVVDCGKEAVEAALADASLEKSSIDFFACHQIGPWMRRAVQDFAGMPQAKSVETFHWAGNLASVNVPLVLSIGDREGMLRDGDLVAMYGGGAGVTYSGIVMRWGR